MQVVPYLSFNGNCREAFELYREVLGGTLGEFHTFGEMPGEVPPAVRDLVMHARLDVAGGGALMGSDAWEGMFEPCQGMSVSLHPSSVSEGRRIFQKLAEGGAVTMPFEPTFWCPGFGMLKDRFGISWMLNCETE